MSNPTPTEDQSVQSNKTVIQTSPTPLRCLTGALMAGGLAIALYYLTTSIAQTFASKPIHSSNPLVINIGAAVRTLVVGVSTLATSIFGIVAIGLVALAIQLSIQQLTKRLSSSTNTQK